MGRSRQRADRIREEIPIIRVLSDYGYMVDPSGEDREQQFSCDLHGDGQDNTPSARAYPDSNSYHCFACGRSRDSIRLVMEKEGVDFSNACRVLEHRYGLPPLAWDEEQKGSTPEDEIQAALTTVVSLEDEVKRVRHLLLAVTAERDLPMETMLALWEAFDKIGWLHQEGKIEERATREAVVRLRYITMEKLRACSSST